MAPIFLALALADLLVRLSRGFLCTLLLAALHPTVRLTATSRVRIFFEPSLGLQRFIQGHHTLPLAQPYRLHCTDARNRPDPHGGSLSAWSPISFIGKKGLRLEGLPP